MAVRRSSCCSYWTLNDSQGISKACCWCKYSVSLYANMWQSVTSTLHVVCWDRNYNLKALRSHYFWFGYVLFPVNMLSKKSVMPLRTGNPHRLKIIHYNTHLIDLNRYLAVFPGAKASDKICETDLNEILFDRMPNIWIRQAYVQSFLMNPLLKKAVNMFERL